MILHPPMPPDRTLSSGILHFINHKLHFSFLFDSSGFLSSKINIVYILSLTESILFMFYPQLFIF